MFEDNTLEPRFYDLFFAGEYANSATAAGSVSHNNEMVALYEFGDELPWTVTPKYVDAAWRVFLCWTRKSERIWVVFRTKIC